MNTKLEYEVSQSLEKASLSKLETKVIEIWRKTEEGSEMYDMLKDLLDSIEIEQKKLDDVKSFLSLIINKL